MLLLHCGLAPQGSASTLGSALRRFYHSNVYAPAQADVVFLHRTSPLSGLQKEPVAPCWGSRMRTGFPGLGGTAAQGKR